MSDRHPNPAAARPKAIRLRLVAATLAIPGALGLLFGLALWVSAHFQCEPGYGSQMDSSCGVTQMWTPVAVGVIIASGVALLVGGFALIAAVPSQYGMSQTAGEGGSAGEGGGGDEGP